MLTNALQCSGQEKGDNDVVEILVEDSLKRAARVIGSSPAIDHWQDGRAEDDAGQMLSDVLDLDDPEDIDPKQVVGSRQQRQFDAMVRRRVAGEPVALIVGYFEFRDLF